MKLKNLIKKIVPAKIFSWYHFTLALLAALYYRFPAKNITVIGITGTKGKTTTSELINSILEQAGFKTALASTLRFKIGDQSERNMLKMTMPGRFFLQQFLTKATSANCDYAIIEMTSEGARFYRHKFIYLDSLVFTGITPEHIESHGSYEKYRQAKLAIVKALANSPKPNKILVVNKDSQDAEHFLKIKTDKKIVFGEETGKPYTVSENGIEFSFANEVIKSKLTGSFNLYNLLAAASLTKALGINAKTIKQAIENFNGILGRMEIIHSNASEVRGKQKFLVIVDYAHTPESLEKVYKTYPTRKKICVLGGTGGGRDHWKREVMGSIVDNYCDEIILTDEDPYDEDPMAIVDDIATGIKTKEFTTIMDRRQAINQAIASASKTEGSVVLITGKGTDPYIMGPEGSKLPWDDATVAKEELELVLKNNA